MSCRTSYSFLYPIMKVVMGPYGILVFNNWWSLMLTSESVPWGFMNINISTQFGGLVLIWNKDLTMGLT